MQIFFIKSVLSIALVFFACIAMFTMFEAFGRAEKKYDIPKLKKIHKANGILYILVFIVTAYLCLGFILETKAELSPRGTFHAVLALAVIVILTIKIILAKFYRQFYEQIKILGLSAAILTFIMVGTSAGYYLLVTRLGTVNTAQEVFGRKAENILSSNIAVKTDPQSIRRGRELYESKCTFCHDPYSNKVIVGPGHKGILKNPFLPVSGKDSTPANIFRQLRHPFSKMPSFESLTDKEVGDIIAFLNTL